MNLNKLKFFYLFVFLLSIIISSCSKSGIIYEQKDYGQKWPFTVTEVRVFCNGANGVYLEADKKIYAVNGVARQNEKLNGRDENALRNITLNDPLYPEIKLGIPDEFIRDALKDCLE